MLTSSLGLAPKSLRNFAATPRQLIRRCTCPPSSPWIPTAQTAFRPAFFNSSSFGGLSSPFPISTRHDAAFVESPSARRTLQTLFSRLHFVLVLPSSFVQSRREYFFSVMSSLHSCRSKSVLGVCDTSVGVVFRDVAVLYTMAFADSVFEIFFSFFFLCFRASTFIPWF